MRQRADRGAVSDVKETYLHLARQYDLLADEVAWRPTRSSLAEPAPQEPSPAAPAPAAPPPTTLEDAVKQNRLEDFVTHRLARGIGRADRADRADYTEAMRLLAEKKARLS